MGSCGIESSLQQFFGSADGWRVDTLPAADGFDSLSHGCVRDVFAVPRHEILHPMYSGRRNMKCIHRGVVWNGVPRDQLASKLARRLVDLEAADPGDLPSTPLGGLRVSASSFIYHEL